MKFPSYRPDDGLTSIGAFDNTAFMELVRECKKRKLPLIVGMDSNAHSSMWGAEDTNNRGRELEEIFFELDLVVLNQGSEYTFDTGNRKSIIDVTVANRFAIEKWNLDDWRVEKGSHFQTTKTFPSLGAPLNQGRRR